MISVIFGPHNLPVLKCFRYIKLVRYFLEELIKHFFYLFILIVLDTYTYDDNILFVEACTQWFLKEKLFNNKTFYAKIEKNNRKNVTVHAYVTL